MAALGRVEEGGDQAQVVDTLGGRMHVRWAEGAAATPHGQLVFFAEFLAATGVFERWVEKLVQQYAGPNRNAKLAPLNESRRCRPANNAIHTHNGRTQSSDGDVSHADRQKWSGKSEQQDKWKLGLF